MAKEIRVALVLDTRGFTQGIRKAKSELNGFDGETKKTTLGLSKLFALGAAGFAIRGIVNTTRELEELRGAFATVSGAAAGTEFERVRELSNRLGTDTNALAEAYVKLAGAGINPTNGLLTTFVDVSKNATDQFGALTAIADLFSRTTAGGLGLEDLNRLADRGIPVFAILQEQLGLSRLEISKYGQSAEGARKIQEALYEGFQERFAGTSLRELNSINSQLMVFQNLSAQAQESFGQGLVNAIAASVGTVGELSGGINELAANLGQALGSALVFIIDNLNIIIPVITAFGAAWAAVKVFQVAQGLMAIVTAIKALTIAMMKNPMTLLAVGAAAAIAGFVALVQETGSVNNALKTIANTGIAVINTLIAGWEAFKTFIAVLLPALARAIADGLNPFSDGSFSRTLSTGFNQAMRSATSKFNQGGPIKFRFTLDPVQRTRPTTFDPTAGGLEFTSAAGPGVDKEAERAAKAAERDAERREELALRNLQTVRESTAALQVETRLFGERLNLDIQLVGVLDAIAERKNKIFDIDKARDRLIADIQAKELSTDPAENARLQAQAIAEVNRQYDEQIEQLGRLIDRRVALINLDTERRATAALFNTLEDARMTAARIQNLTEAFEYEREFNLASEAATARATSLKAQYIEEERRAREAATAEELIELDRLKAAEFDRIDSDLRNKLAAARTTRDLNKMEFEAARTFAVGMAQASNEAMLRLTDNAQFAKDMFNMTMNGFTDAILNFVETGKLSFKDLFKSLMTEIIKMQANKLFMSLFGGDGILGSLLPGVFGKKAVGGPVRAGMPYVVGERGPELFVPSGPGTVVANDRLGGGGITQVTYNINAVDAMSFKQMVARDPEFIYSVTQAGARRLPR